ncbi:hypothetical protein Z043_125892, partial [Scleropages formosus]
MCNTLAPQGAIISAHEQSRERLEDTVKWLHPALQTAGILQSPVTTMPAVPADPAPPAPLEESGPDTTIAIPERYDGSPDQCQDFLMQCELVFECSPRMYQTDEAKIALELSLFSCLGSSGVMHPPEDHLHCFFWEKFEMVFDHSHAGHSAGDRLWHLNQGNRTLAEYALKFRSLATRSCWNTATAITIDNLGRNRQMRWGQVTLPAYPAEEDPEPMQVGGGRLGPKERRRCLVGNLCLYCGSPDHFRSTCPVRPPQGDSRESKVKALDGQPLGSSVVNTHTIPLQLETGACHHEVLTFFMIRAPDTLIILGYPWLTRHNPVFRWSTND